MHEDLERSAAEHSQNMAMHDFFGHQGMDRSSPWDRIEAVGYDTWTLLAENVAGGYATPQEVVEAWLDSPDHRANMLNADLREAGAGYFFEAEDTYPGEAWGYQHYWTLNMGARWDAYPVVIEREAYSTTNRLVSLYLYGADWAVEMRLSNDGIDWTQWQSFRTSLAWELSPGNGAKRVYVQLRDAQGTFLSSEDEILLQEPPPLPPPQEDLRLRAYPARVSFVLQEGSRQSIPQLQRLQVHDGTSAIAWHASWDQDWLRLSTSASIAPSRIPLTLTEQAALLPVGVHTATVWFEGEGQKAEIAVSLYVFPQVYGFYLPTIPRGSRQ
jgi:hypothetical protein